MGYLECMTHNAELINVRERWSGAWRIWRARRSGDVGDERTGDFVASRIDPKAGVERTVIRSTPSLLDEALRQQRAAVAEGRKPLDVGTEVRPGQ